MTYNLWNNLVGGLRFLTSKCLKFKVKKKFKCSIYRKVKLYFLIFFLRDTCHSHSSPIVLFNIFSSSKLGNSFSLPCRTVNLNNRGLENKVTKQGRCRIIIKVTWEKWIQVTVDKSKIKNGIKQMPSMNHSKTNVVFKHMQIMLKCTFN